MLKLILRLLVGLIPLCVLVLVGGVALLVRAAAPPFPLTEPRLEAFGFGACALPCYAGIMPGETRFPDVIERIIDHVPSLDRRMLGNTQLISFWGTAHDVQFSGQVRYRDGQVGDIVLSTPLRLAWLLDTLGAPTCVYPRDETVAGAITLLIWEFESASVYAALKPSAALVDLYTGETINLWLSANPAVCIQQHALNWHGFAFIWAYQRDIISFAE